MIKIFYLVDLGNVKGKGLIEYFMIILIFYNLVKKINWYGIGIWFFFLWCCNLNICSLYIKGYNIVMKVR